MNFWSDTVMTTKGLALQSKLIAGNSLVITKIEVGSGFVTPGLLQQQTAITSPMVTFDKVTELVYPEAGKCAIKINVDNDAITMGFTAKQVGIYATDPDEGEILYFISQDATGSVIPSNAEMESFSAEWCFTFQYGQADNVTVTVDKANTVSRAGMESYVNGVLVNYTKNDPTPLGAGQTILDYTGSKTSSVTVNAVKPNLPSDGPEGVSGSYSITVEANGDKTVIFTPVDGVSGLSWEREIVNGAWNGSWKLAGNHPLPMQFDMLAEAFGFRYTKAVSDTGTTYTETINGVCPVTATRVSTKVAVDGGFNVLTETTIGTHIHRNTVVKQSTGITSSVEGVVS